MSRASLRFIVLFICSALVGFFHISRAIAGNTLDVTDVFLATDGHFLPPLTCVCMKAAGVCPLTCCERAAVRHLGKVYRISATPHGGTITIRQNSGPPVIVAVYGGAKRLCSNSLQHPQADELEEPALAKALAGSPDCNAPVGALVWNGVTAQEYFLVVYTTAPSDPSDAPLPFGFEISIDQGAVFIEPAICVTPTPPLPTPTSTPVGCPECRALADIVSLEGDIGVTAKFLCDTADCRDYLDGGWVGKPVALRAGAWYRPIVAGDPPAPTAAPPSNPGGQGPASSGVPDPLGSGYKIHLETGYYLKKDVCEYTIYGPRYCTRWHGYSWARSYDPSVPLINGVQHGVAFPLSDGASSAGVHLTHAQDTGTLSALFVYLLKARKLVPLHVYGLIGLMQGAMLAGTGISGELAIPYPLIDPQLKYVCREMKTYAGLFADNQGMVALRGLIIEPKIYETSPMCPCGSLYPVGPVSGTPDYEAHFLCLLNQSTWFGRPMSGTITDRSDLMKIWTGGSSAYVFCGNTRRVDCLGPN